MSDHPRNLSHRLFILTLLAKAALGVIQLLTAAALALGVTEKLPGLVRDIVLVELREDPNDFLASRVLQLSGLVAQTDTHFYFGYFAAHGILHVGVVAALLYGSAIAYPAAIGVLAVFVLYQAYEWIHVGGAMLILLSAIDVAVIYLTVIEWRQRRAV